MDWKPARTATWAATGAAALALTLATPAAACFCSNLSQFDPGLWVLNYDVVFYGNKTGDSAEADGRRAHDVTVTEQFSGQKSDRVRVVTPGDSCSFPTQTGQAQVIFAKREGDHFTASLCDQPWSHPGPTTSTEALLARLREVKATDPFRMFKTDRR
jgi:hypothetical protein